MRKVRVKLWVKIPGYLVTLGNGASVESAAKCLQKRNVCAVKKWSQFDISTYMVTKDQLLKILLQKNLVSYMPSFPQSSFLKSPYKVKNLLTAFLKFLSFQHVLANT